MVRLLSLVFSLLSDKLDHFIISWKRGRFKWFCFAFSLPLLIHVHWAYLWGEPIRRNDFSQVTLLWVFAVLLSNRFGWFFYPFIRPAFYSTFLSDTLCRHWNLLVICENDRDTNKELLTIVFVVHYSMIYAIRILNSIISPPSSWSV